MKNQTVDIQVITWNLTDNVRKTKLINKLYTRDYNTVNSEIFARILFSRITLKDIFATLEICDLCMIYVYQ